MTRFARAKGSKSSNERVPNEATPWHVMKEQLEDKISMKNNRTPKAKSAKELLSEKDQPFYCDSTGNVNNEWAEFEREKKSIEKPNKSKKITNSSESKKNIIEYTNSTVENDNSEISSKSKKNKRNSSISESKKTESIDSTTMNDSSKILPKSKKNKRNSLALDDSQAQPVNGTAKNPEKSPKKQKIDDIEETESQNVNESEKKSKKSKKKVKIVASEMPDACELPKSSDEKPTKSEDNKTEGAEKSEAAGKSLKISKRHKRNQKRISKNALLNAEAGVKKPETGISRGFDAAGNDWSSDVKFGKKIDKSKGSAVGNAAGNFANFPKNPASENNGAKRKAPKIRDDKEHKRRKPDSGSIKCVINGMEVEIVKFDGFPVKKEDAERLKELRQQMVMKGIPKSEIDVAMKLERRKAEKSLARVRKQVCFHCRKAGHNLSDCPELGEEESATGICFKCGSTEHTHFECKVNKKEEFRFASCFICREQGHIAKQCPDNPKGLYPQGGSCKICGDVTHLRKDCPDLTREKEETTITVGTIAENTLESLDDNSTNIIPSDESKKPKSKIVKF